MAKTRLYILSGFLGAGKTTVLRKILENLKDCRIGVIQNELGKIGIDGIALRGEDIQMTELNRGSIFCTCLKLSFVKALAEMAEKGFDYLFVESSGFGDPSNIEEILEAVKVAAGDRYDFCGCICLIDAVNFLERLEEMETTARQLKHCQLAVLTKTDLASEEQIQAAIDKIPEINPVCPVWRSENGNIDMNFLNMNLMKYQWAPPEESTNSVETKPKTIYMNFEGEAEREKLESFLRILTPDVYRIKGFFLLKGEGWKKVDVVGPLIDYAPCEPQELSQLVFISRIGTAVIRKVFDLWEREVGLPMQLKN